MDAPLPPTAPSVPGPSTTAPAPGAGPRDRAFAVVVGLAALAWLAVQTPRVPGIGDAAEFTLALAAAGVPHPTGYPLYVLTGHLVVGVLHALGASWPFAANLFSVLAGALAVGLVAALGARLVGGRVARPAGVAAAAMLATNPVWISGTTIAEVYALTCASAAACALFAWTLAGRIERATTRDAAAWGLLAGIGLANHLTAVLIVGPLSLALAVGLVQARAWRARFLAAAAAGALLPLSTYGWLWWRAHHPSPVDWPLEPTLASVAQHVRAAAYTFYVGHFHPDPVQRQMLTAGVLPEVILGLAVGTVAATRVHAAALRLVALALLLGAALVIAFVFQYGVPDPAYFFLVPLLVASLAAAPVVAAVAARMRPVLATALVAGLALAGAAWGLRVHQIELARTVRAEARIRAAWRSLPPGPAIVMWNDDHVDRLRIYQWLDGERRDLVLADPSLLTWPAGRAGFLHATGIDPLAGLALRTREDADRIPENVARQSSVPVIRFERILR